MYFKLCMGGQTYFFSLPERKKVCMVMQCYSNLTWMVLFHVALCVEVYVSMGSNECDGRMPYNQADMPVYVCSSDEEKSRMITLQCCTNPTPLCIESSSEWWYKHVNKLNGTFQKYQEVDSTNLAPVYINNTDHPIRYLCTISASYGCEGGSGYIDIQGGIYLKYIDSKVFEFCAMYRIAQNGSGGKFWRINHFIVLARKTSANLTLTFS